MREYIAYYYFHSSDDDSFNYTFSYFPNFKNALTVYRQALVKKVGTKNEIRPGKEEPTVIYSFNTKYQGNVSIKGKFNKLGIVFQPLGINYFLDQALAKHFEGGFQRFHGFGEPFISLSKAVLDAHDFDLRVKLLDEFFLSNRNDFDQPPLKKAICLILFNKGTITIQQLSEQIGVSRKTLLRLFKQHLCCSVKEYCKMVKFRSAVETFIDENPTLTELAYKAFYYDQSHFINQFKELTTESPKEVLPHLKELSEFGFFVKEEE